MKKETFNYNYSAKEQEEIKKIREKYVPEEDDKMEQLRKLDAGVTKKAVMISLTVGIISLLILGTGMSCCMVFAGVWFVPGIIIGAIGIIGVSLSYSVYNKVTEIERRKITPEIIKLTDELMK